jgi:hypothetical protein
VSDLKAQADRLIAAALAGRNAGFISDLARVKDKIFMGAMSDLPGATYVVVSIMAALTDETLKSDDGGFEQGMRRALVALNEAIEDVLVKSRGNEGQTPDRLT